MKWLTKIVDLAKLPTKLVAWIFIFATTLLFIPTEWLTTIKLHKFTQDYGLYIGFAFLGSGVLLCIESIRFLWRANNKRKVTNKKQETVQQSLANLDPNEKAVLREFYIQGQHTIQLPIDQPVVAGLIHKGVLRVVGKYAEGYITAGMLTSITLSKEADPFVNEQLIDLPEGMPTPEQRRYTESLRPRFMQGIERINNLKYGNPF